MNYNLKYRADIDGLRALAVLSVVFYHAGLGFPGGYVGVDVFFVISGYLITALILKDLERGSFTMVSFWERRIRRIFPALAVMVAVTMVAGWYLLLPEDLAKFGASVIAQSLLVSNFYFWRTTNYFGGANEEKPLLHTWSLAVEEQFYLIFPIALMAIWAFFNYRLKKEEERNLTTECTELKAGARLAGQAGAVFLDPFASELARDCANTAPTRFASIPAPSDTSYSPPVTSPLGDQRRWTLFWIFSTVALLSFGLSIWGVIAQPIATFFLLPTRAWELLLGSLVAVLPAKVCIRNIAVREVLCVASLAGICVTVFFYGAKTPFPGLAALPPCMATAILIWANTPRENQTARGLVAAALSWRPAVFIGLISYSLYLWHWPILSFAEYLQLKNENTLFIWALLAVSLLLSVFSWKFVERPFRKKEIIKSRKIIFISAAATTVGICVIAAGLNFGAGFPNRFPEKERRVMEKIGEDFKEVEKLHHWLKEIEKADELCLEKSVLWGRTGNGTECRFLVWGDSHGRYPIDVLDEEFDRLGIAAKAVIHHRTAPLFDFKNDSNSGLPVEDVQKIGEKTLDFIVKHQIKHVMIAAYWSLYQKAAGESNLRHSIQSTILKLNEAGAFVWIFADWPDHDFDPNRVMIFSSNRLLSFLAERKRTKEEHFKKNSALLDAPGFKGDFVIIDPHAAFLESNSEIFKTRIGDNPIYFDDNHLTRGIGAKLLADSLKQVLVNSINELVVGQKMPDSSE